LIFQYYVRQLPLFRSEPDTDLVRRWYRAGGGVDLFAFFTTL